MRRLALVAILLGAATARADPPRVELELGIGGAPSGIVGARALLRGGPLDTAIAVGGGAGLTGAIFAVGIDQPFHRARPASHPSFTYQYSLYASYAIGTLASWSRDPFGARDNMLYDGRYQWIDVGLHVRTEIGRFYLGLGAGVAILVGHPDPIGDEDIEDEDVVGYFTASGWTRMEHGGPMLWSSVGYLF